MPMDSEQPTDGLKAFKSLGVVPATKQLQSNPTSVGLLCTCPGLNVMHLEKERKEKEEA